MTGEAIVGANILKDIMAAVRDVVGGRAAAYEKALREMAQHGEARPRVYVELSGAGSARSLDVLPKMRVLILR